MPVTCFPPRKSKKRMADQRDFKLFHLIIWLFLTFKKGKEPERNVQNANIKY
jgi:hypothetical protein